MALSKPHIEALVQSLGSDLKTERLIRMDPQDKLLPDRCLICYCRKYASTSVPETGKPRPRSKRRKGAEADSSVLSRQLDSIFVLRNLLQIPVENLHMYLLSWGKPESWIYLCRKCEIVVQEARDIHERIVKWNARFKEVQKRVIDGIKRSNSLTWSVGSSSDRIITDQSRSFASIYDYGHFTDPFVLGDKKAHEQCRGGVKNVKSVPGLVPSRRSEREHHQERNDPADSIVKREVDDAMDGFEDVFNDQEFLNEADTSDIFWQEDRELSSTYEADPLDISSGASNAEIPKTLKMQQLNPKLDKSSKSNASFDIANFPTKVCNECQVTFPERTFDLHLDYWHNKGIPDISEETTFESRAMEKPESNFTSSDKTQVPESCQNEEMGNTKIKLLKSVDKPNSLTCSVCFRTFKREERALAHKSLHETSPFHCFICRSAEKGFNSLRWHMWNYHKSESYPDITPPVKRKVADSEIISRIPSQKCDRCGRFIKPELMIKHIELHENSPYHCTVCRHVFETNKQLTGHLSKYHRKAYLEYKEALRKVPRIKSKAGSSSSKQSETDNRRKSCRERIPTLKVNQTSASDFSDEDKRDDDQDSDWNPEEEESKTAAATSTPGKSSKTTKGKFKKRKSFYCPACQNFKYMDGEVDKLMNHFELCEVIKNPDNDHGERTLTCPRCNEFKVSIPENKMFCEHLLMCGVNQVYTPLTCRIFECNVCPTKLYFRLQEFLEHFLDHTKNIYKCSRCPKRFAVTSHVHRHWAEHHRELLRQVRGKYRSVKDTSVPEVFWWCKICNQKFTSEDDRDTHVQASHNAENVSNEKPHNCQECYKAYECSDELRLHQGTYHPRIPMNIYICDMCNLRFSTAKQLKMHRMKEHRVDLLVCEVCGTECNSKVNLINHMQRHQEVKRYVCNDCGESYATSQLLRNHTYQKHTPLDPKVNPLVCPYCDPPQALYNKSYLQQHIQGIHQGQFKFRCEICNFGAHNNYGMKKHMAGTHQVGSLKRFGCTMEGCSKSFLTRGKLKIHLSRHTEPPNIACKYCDKCKLQNYAFNIISNLKNYIDITYQLCNFLYGIHSIL